MKSLELRLSPELAFNEADFEAYLAKKAKLQDGDHFQYRIERRNIDARSRNIKVNILVHYAINEDLPARDLTHFEFQDVHQAPEVHIVGFGPAGMWAALRCIELGYKPVVLERGFRPC